MLAVAQRHSLRFRDRELYGSESGSLVRAVAKRLRLGTSAGTPPVITGGEWEDGGLSVEDNFFSHGSGVYPCLDPGPTCFLRKDAAMGKGGVKKWFPEYAPSL